MEGQFFTINKINSNHPSCFFEQIWILKERSQQVDMNIYSNVKSCNFVYSFETSLSNNNNTLQVWLREELF